MNGLIKLVLVLAAVGVGMKLFAVGPFADADAGRGLDALLTRAESEGKDKVVVLLTGTDWCPYCKDLERNVLQTGEWQTFANSEIVFESFEYPAMRRPKSGVKGEMLERFDIEGFPTMVVLGIDGEILDEQAGYGGDSPGELVDWIRTL